MNTERYKVVNVGEVKLIPIGKHFLRKQPDEGPYKVALQEWDFDTEMWMTIELDQFEFIGKAGKDDAERRKDFLVLIDTAVTQVA